MSKKWLILVSAAVLVGIAAVSLWLYREHQEHSHHFYVVDRGHLYRSRQPHEGDMREGLLRRDVRRIVNLRPEREDPKTFAEEKRVCADLGITMINLPVELVVPTMDQVREFLISARRTDGATLVHCEHGRNRTSVMVAAYRIVVQNKTVDQACAEMKRYTNLDKDQGLTECRKFLQLVADQRQQLLVQTAPGTTTATSQMATTTQSTKS